MMKVIGITGNIGSGKSAVSSILRELGAVHIDADKVTHEVYRPGTGGWSEIVNAFGRDVLAEDGTIDRRKLARIVFNDANAVAKLNRLLHPRIRREIEERLDALRKTSTKVVVVEAILLIEAGWADMMDEIWLVVAPQSDTLKRLKRERGLSEADVLARLTAQTPPEKNMRYATRVVNNDGTLEELQKKVRVLWREMEAQQVKFQKSNLKDTDQKSNKSKPNT